MENSYRHFKFCLDKSNSKMPRAIEVFQNTFGGSVMPFIPDCNDAGIDCIWVNHAGQELFIDFKILFWPDNGLIPLEYRDEAGRPGWAVDPRKATDLFAFYWARTETLRVFAAPRLRLAAIRNAQVWLPDLKCFKRHRNYVAFVPAAEVEAAITPAALVDLERRAV